MRGDVVAPGPFVGCEVQDWVIYPDGSLVYRNQNAAANDELARRGQFDQVVNTGDVQPYGIRWVNTCGGYVDDPSATYAGPYGFGDYGLSYYGGQKP